MRGSEGWSLRHIAGNRGLLLAPSPLYNLKEIYNAKRCREIVLQPDTLAAMQGPAPDRIHACPDTLRTRGDPSTPPAPAGPEPVIRSKDASKSPDIPGQPDEPLATPCPRRTAAPPSKHSPAPKNLNLHPKARDAQQCPRGDARATCRGSGRGSTRQARGGRAFVMH